jgi:hypothetical protein
VKRLDVAGEIGGTGLQLPPIDATRDGRFSAVHSLLETPNARTVFVLESCIIMYTYMYINIPYLSQPPFLSLHRVRGREGGRKDKAESRAVPALVSFPFQ